MITFTELRRKEVINIKDGTRMGHVVDLQLDPATGTICAIVVPGCAGISNIWRGGGDYIIPWKEINQIGDDVILVCATPVYPTRCGRR